MRALRQAAQRRAAAVEEEEWETERAAYLQVIAVGYSFTLHIGDGDSCFGCDALCGWRHQLRPTAAARGQPAAAVSSYCGGPTVPPDQHGPGRRRLLPVAVASMHRLHPRAFLDPGGALRHAASPVAVCRATVRREIARTRCCLALPRRLARHAVAAAPSRRLCVWRAAAHRRRRRKWLGCCLKRRRTRTRQRGC